jgi:hypothetical protein
MSISVEGRGQGEACQSLQGGNGGIRQDQAKEEHVT